MVSITHKFHPLYGQEFPLLLTAKVWGCDRVHAVDPDGKRFSLPRSWTSLADDDDFVRVSGGRSFFRIDDLLSLADLIDGFNENKGEE